MTGRSILKPAVVAAVGIAGAGKAVSKDTAVDIAAELAFSQRGG